MLSILKREVTDPNHLALIGGTEDTYKILSDEWLFTNFITVQEMAALFPTLVPLSHKANYPENADELTQRVYKRLGKSTLELSDLHFKTVMVMANPYMWETHMQIISDVLISKGG